MLPSQLFELADELHQHGFEDEDPLYLTRVAYAMEFEDDCYVISNQSLDAHYNDARHLRREYFM